MKSSFDTDPRQLPRFTLELLLLALTAFVFAFYLGRNQQATPSAPMALPTTLWLNYTLGAFLVIPAFLACSPGVSPVVRLIHGIVFLGFLLRAAVEVGMRYGFHAWSAPYGIVHDVLQFALIVGLLLYYRGPLRAADSASDTAALCFLSTIRLALIVEIVLSILIYRVAQAESGPSAAYFTDNSRDFLVIDILTTLAVVIAYRDLWRTLRRFGQARIMERAS